VRYQAALRPDAVYYYSMTRSIKQAENLESRMIVGYKYQRSRLIMQLNEIIPWGRTFAEYQQMFDLSDADLNKRIFRSMCLFSLAIFVFKATIIGFPCCIDLRTVENIYSSADFPIIKT
jgi:hypothetical protein